MRRLAFAVIAAALAYACTRVVDLTPSPFDAPRGPDAPPLFLDAFPDPGDSLELPPDIGGDAEPVPDAESGAVDAPSGIDAVTLDAAPP